MSNKLLSVLSLEPVPLSPIQKLNIANGKCPYCLSKNSPCFNMEEIDQESGTFSAMCDKCGKYYLIDFKITLKYTIEIKENK